MLQNNYDKSDVAIYPYMLRTLNNALEWICTFNLWILSIYTLAIVPPSFYATHKIESFTSTRYPARCVNGSNYML